MGVIREQAKRLPKGIVRLLKINYYRRQIRKGEFRSEEREYDVLKNIIPAGAKVVDIGANVGYYTLLFSSLVGSKGRVIAFEPIPETFDLLSNNVTASAAQNVTLINGAVSTDTQEVDFTIPEENLFQSHMVPEGEIHVMSFPLSSFLPKSWSLDFLKIDAEGCDEEIIKSSIGVINSHRPFVMAELAQEKAKGLVGVLENYSLRFIEGSHNKFFVPNEKLDLFPL
ncbi:MAG: FkbM family methyltransferase [Marinobacter sp.]|uniref:FkbM family methyltransferase n=1 Tax=Marinobacter sp. TaxID=50741 RepID=UPI00396EFDD7